MSALRHGPTNSHHHGGHRWHATATFPPRCDRKSTGWWPGTYRTMLLVSSLRRRGRPWKRTKLNLAAGKNAHWSTNLNVVGVTDGMHCRFYIPSTLLVFIWGAASRNVRVCDVLVPPPPPPLPPHRRFQAHGQHAFTPLATKHCTPSTARMGTCANPIGISWMHGAC